MLSKEIEYQYWEINFISCEGNKRWSVARTPIDWDVDQLESKISIGGCGDDVAEIISIDETNEKDFGWDFFD